MNNYNLQVFQLNGVELIGTLSLIRLEVDHWATLCHSDSFYIHSNCFYFPFNSLRDDFSPAFYFFALLFVDSPHPALFSQNNQRH